MRTAILPTSDPVIECASEGTKEPSPSISIDRPSDAPGLGIIERQEAKPILISDDSAEVEAPLPVDKTVDTAFDGNDQVEEIKWWIEFGRKHHKGSTWSSFLSAAISIDQVEQDLSRFIPDRRSIQETWLNDRVILYLISQLFRAEEDTQVLDPVLVEAAFCQQDTEILNVDPDAKLLIVPCHTVNHWSLIVIDTVDMHIDTYNMHHDKSSRIAQFIVMSLPSTNSWVERHKPVSS